MYLLNHILVELKVESRVDLSQDKVYILRIREVAEQAEIELSSTAQTEVNLPYITSDATGAKHINLGLGAVSSSPCSLANSMIGPCENALSNAGLEPNKIDEIVLVGKMSHMRKVIEAEGLPSDGNSLRIST